MGGSAGGWGEKAATAAFAHSRTWRIRAVGRSAAVSEARAGGRAEIADVDELRWTGLRQDFEAWPRTTYAHAAG